MHSQSSLLKTDIWYDSGQQSINQLQNNTLSKSILQRTGMPVQDSVALLNFHRVKTFGEAVSSFRAGFDISKSSRLTVIAVYHSPDTSTEHGIWSVMRDGKQVTGLTDKRLLRQKSEYQYPVKKRGIPLINTSMQAFSKIRGKADSNHFVLGEAILPDSTLSTFTGDIAECLVFSRFLKKAEALKIETYLAIKYGISLIESDYLSSSEVVLWSYEENKDYSNGIAGIGRDSTFGLDQKQGSSSEEEDLLTIHVGDFSPLNEDNSFAFPEANYLVWGHNERELIYNELDCEQSYPLLERKWLMQTTYTDVNNKFPTMVKLQLPEQYRDTSRLCYLVIDRSGTGNFSFEHIEYIAQNQMDENGFVCFNNIIWDSDASGKDIFTFSFGAEIELMATNSCPDSPTGSIRLNICGGKAPFDYVLIHDSTHQQFEYRGLRDYTFEGLPSGHYRLTVVDSNTITLSKEVEVEGFPSIASLLPIKYSINNSGNLFDAEDYFGASASYLWEKDSVFLSEESAIDMSKSGRYKLTVTDSNGCRHVSEIEARKGVLSDNHKSNTGNTLQDFQQGQAGTPAYRVYPNPTAGEYRVEANFPEKSPVTVRILTVNGSLLETWQDSGRTEYVFDSYLPTMGTYLIEIESIFGIENFKIAVVK